VEEYEVGPLHLLEVHSVQILNNRQLSTPPSKNKVMAVVHVDVRTERALHYSLIRNAWHRSAHSFDSLYWWTDEAARKLVAGAFPRMEEAKRVGVHNHTGRLRHSGATCEAAGCWGTRCKRSTKRESADPLRWAHCVRLNLCVSMALVFTALASTE